MEEKHKPRQKILIADDSELNRAILSDMLDGEYDILEAENGVQAVSILQKHEGELSLVLLDIVMPQMDGFGVLTEMNARHWIDEVPVIMISAESGSVHIERAYKLGCTDFISRPFDALIVHRRVVNTILLYTKQKNLIGMLADQVLQRERQSSMMVDILSHIVEFRNGESGSHVRHIRVLADKLLHLLLEKESRYTMAPELIPLVGTAAALHDIGKIAIPESILNKPGRLTAEEFEIMKTHTLEGAKLLKALPLYQDEPLMKMAYAICRWHHERWDGKGYPDGLAGDDIPIAAQVVALADVYDALTSERVYKPPYSHEKAVQMILDGQCGTFNPLLMECLRDHADVIRDDLDKVQEDAAPRESRRIVEELSRREGLAASERTLQLLEHERMKYSFFAAMSQEIQFEYTMEPPMVTISAWGAQKLGVDEVIMNPRECKAVHELQRDTDIEGLAAALRATTPDQPIVKYDCRLHLNGEARWTRIIARATWSADQPPQYVGAIGKAVDIHEEHMKLTNLERLASHDVLLDLYNYNYARKLVTQRLLDRPASHFAVIIFDLDRFKQANDTYGHLFGNRVLQHIAEKLHVNVREGDIAARAGGDEFLVAIEYREHIELAVQRLFRALTGEFEAFTISISMGVALTEKVGRTFDRLFHAADQALYACKRNGRGCYCFYDEQMEGVLSMISPIENEEAAQRTDDAREQ